ncbi:MAG TPA: NAD(P)/FAD-dependent oxidoreductase [Thermomicrobiales bacterium]|nr:NAD(P)/FAD-dependent oxidoreductase [Thermomicrobiales bacterium]
MTSTHDAVIIGAGPNGLAAGITLAQAGRSVLILEAKDTIGGGCRTLDLTLPGYRHDPCSAIHPLAVVSPFFRTLPLAQYGLEMIEPPLALANPFDDGTAVVLAKSVDETAASLGPDADAYKRLLNPLIRDRDILIPELLGPLRIPPRHPIAMARFGLVGLRSAKGLVHSRFKGRNARALFAGMAAHSMLRMDQLTTAAFGLTLALFGHAVNWPIPRGGSQAIVDALAAHFRSLGGEIRTSTPVDSIEQYKNARAILFDTTPRQFLALAGDQVPGRYRRQLSHYRYGPGVFKIDLALSGPVPWTAPECRRAGTVHLGGSYEEIAASEADACAGRHSERPYVIVAQQSLFDPTRAPDDHHTLWAYCHVPSGSDKDMTGAIEGQIERFAPGFRDLVIARSVMGPSALQDYNPNYIGGDINGGLQDIRQIFTRPAVRLDPYSTPNKRLYLCSSSTPPGGGVHGMAGHHAAKSVMRRET